MKKIFATLMCALMCAAGAFGMAACGDAGNGGNGGNGGNTNEPTTVSVYAPDGAPALALANFIDAEQPEVSATSAAPAEATYKYEFHVVAANTIQAQVTGGSPKADLCILPVNLAAKLLGTGEAYQMLGTVTNGNMYFLTTGTNEQLTADNLATLVGKTVGVVQLSNVPGLTFQSVLKDKGIAYQILNGDTEKAQDKVNLQAFQDATTVTPAAGCDYYLCPEPAVTTKLAKVAAFKLAGNLQELYGGGYPQAVLVAKKSVLAIDAVRTHVLDLFAKSGDALKNYTPEKILSLLDGVRTADLTPSFTAENLNATVIANCSVAFTPAKDCKDKVNAFLDKLIAVDPAFTKTVADSFYYLG